MIQVANVPYLRTYKFALLSDAFLLKYLLYGLALLLPFFMVYSVNSTHRLPRLLPVLRRCGLRLAHFHLRL